MREPPPGVLGFDQPADKPAVRLRAAAAGGREPDPDWLARHDGFKKRARQGGIDLFLTGDSITDMWPSACAAHYAKCFGAWRSANFAIGGDRTEHLLWRLANGEMEGFEPRAVMLLIGTNNLPSIQGVYSAKRPEEVAAGVRAVLDLIRRRWPAARFLLPSIMPREDRLEALPPAVKEDLNPKVQMLNRAIAAMADGDHIKFVNMYERFLDARGRLIEGVMPDKLHPAEKGYAIWAEAILPTLREWLG